MVRARKGVRVLLTVSPVEGTYKMSGWVGEGTCRKVGGATWVMLTAVRTSDLQ